MAQAGVRYLPAEVTDVLVKDGGMRAEVHCADGTTVKCRWVLGWAGAQL